MENTVSNSCEAERGYLAEFDFFDGDDFVTFNIIGYSLDRSEILVAVTDRGKISLVTYDILTDKTGRRYFEYGCIFTSTTSAKKTKFVYSKVSATTKNA